MTQEADARDRASQVIAHQFGPEASALLRARVPDAVIRELPRGPIAECPAGYGILLSGPSMPWRDRPVDRPAGWPGSLRWLQLPAAGVDGYPRWFLDAPAVSTGLGVNAVPIAEYVLAVILAHEKNIPGLWVDSREAWKTKLLGTLAGRTIGLLGVGNIGREIARRARAFDMRVIAHRRRPEAPLPPDVDRVVPVEELFASADHIVLAIPANDATRGMVNAALLARCKPTAHLVNVGRGALIDTPALLAALDAGRPALATLDVTFPEPPVAGDPLYTHPRVRLSPHVSFSSPTSLERLVDRFVQNLGRWRAGEPLIAPLGAE